MNNPAVSEDQQPRIAQEVLKNQPVELSDEGEKSNAKTCLIAQKKCKKGIFIYETRSEL